VSFLLNAVNHGANPHLVVEDEKFIQPQAMSAVDA
jgi:hypothetical protein